MAKATKPAALQLGLALVPGEKGKDGELKRGPRLLAADGINGFNGVIDDYDSPFSKVESAGLFVDPDSESLAPPYNVMFLQGRVCVPTRR